MQRMTKTEFLSLVASNEDDAWPGGEALARALALHIPDAESIAGWMWLDREQLTPSRRLLQRYGQAGIVGDRHFFLLHLMMGLSMDPTSVQVQSAPMGRLRAVRTKTFSDGRGSFTLDFAGPVFEGNYRDIARNEVSFSWGEGEPDEEIVTAFLAAIAEVRK